jgi:hypothetical protein
MIMQSPPAAPYMPPPPSPRKRGLRPIAIVGLVLAGLLVMCGLGIVVVGLLASARTPTPLPSPASPVVSNTGSPSVHLSTAAPTKAAAPAPPPRITIPDGTWTIGEDYPAGRYVATGTDGTCYWEVDRSGTNGQDIVSNGTGPGNLRVSLKAGQDFHSQNCGTWVKQ